MDFVERSEGLDQDAGVIAYVTPNRVAGYEAELEKRVGSVTLHGNIYKLRRIAQLLNPAADLEWLCDLEKDLALVMRPRSKFSRLVYSHVLIEAGLALMTEAHSAMKNCAATSLSVPKWLDHRVPSLSSDTPQEFCRT